MSDHNGDDLHAPVLLGPGASDYERYLCTDELLSLQKTAEERGHHDELLFQTVHQSSELWLKFAWTEVEEAAAALERDDPAAAARLLRRSALSLARAVGRAGQVGVAGQAGARFRPALRVRPACGTSGARGQAGALARATAARISAPTRATASFPRSSRLTSEKKAWTTSS